MDSTVVHVHQLDHFATLQEVAEHYYSSRHLSEDEKAALGALLKTLANEEESVHG